MPTTCKLIAKNVLGSSAASVTFSDIPGTYTDLLLVVSARTTFSAPSTFDEQLNLTLNASTSNFSSRILFGNGTTVASGTSTPRFAGHANNADSTANTFGNFEVYFPNYAGSTNKSWSGTSVFENNFSVAFIVATAGLWSNTAAITSIGLSGANSGNIVSGSSFYLYGITKA